MFNTNTQSHNVSDRKLAIRIMDWLFNRKIMTPREKASQLIVDYQIKCKSLNYNEAKQCALIAVDEILKDREEIDGMRIINDPYWMEVKQEIKKL